MTDDDSNDVTISGGDIKGLVQENKGIVTQNFISLVSDSINGQACDRQITKQEYRQRQVLLSKVKQYWIEGVLNKSLHAKAIELHIIEEQGAVEKPFTSPEGPPKQIKEGVANFFNQMGEGRTLLILGEPGAGKTITLLKLARDLIARAEEDPSNLIPVVFSLSSWGLGSKQLPTIKDWLVQQLFSQYQVSKPLGEDWIKDQKMLLLLDGLDEVRADRREDCIQAINQFIQNYGQTEIVVCSRIGDYKALSKRLKLRGAILLRSLTLKQVDQYLDSAGEQLQAVKTLVHEDPVLQELAKLPLTLSVMTLTYQGKKVEELPQSGSLEESYQHLFDDYIKRMFNQEKIGKPPEYNSPYKNQQTKLWLTWLAKRMNNNQSIFQIEQLQPTWLLSAKHRKIYRIVVGLVLGLLVGFMAGMYFIYKDSPYGYKLSCPFKPEMLSQLKVGLLSGLIYGIFLGQKHIIKNKNLTKLISGIIFATTSTTLFKIDGTDFKIDAILIVGIISACISGLIREPIQSIETIKPESNKIIKYSLIMLGFGLLYILLRFRLTPEFYQAKPYFWVQELLIFIVLGALYGGFKIKQKVLKTILPNEGIRRSLKYTVIFFVTFMFVQMLYAWSFEEIRCPFYLICIGLTIGLLAGLGGNQGSGIISIQHFILRVFLHWKGDIPWNYARFLNYATERIFLQKIGGSYIFIHRMLLEHFARMERHGSRRANLR